jgi:steroid delta-isomerase-like uncharacterized protein
MTRDELRAVVERYMEMWQRRDPAALAACHAPDGIVESPIYATRVGRKAIEEAHRAFFTSFPDATLAVEAIIVDPPHAATFATVNATHVNEFFGLPGTNRHLEFRTSRLVRVDDLGLIAHERRIYDFTGLLVQVGVLRAKPGKP